MEPHPTAPSRRPDAIIVATGAFTMVKVSPPSGLEGLVVELALYRETSGKPIRQVESASLVVPLLIGFADPFKIAIGRAPTGADGFHSFTSGLTLRPVNILSAGNCSCLQINLTPPGARRFFGLPMSELTGQMVALDDLGDAPLARLRRQLGDEPDWDRRFALAEAFLFARMQGTAEPSRATAWAYQRIVATGGRASVSRLAREVDWSRKHLAARFHDEIGLPPKQVARIARFQSAQKLAASGKTEGWADIAAACGYADQAHLAREFRGFAGATPSAWLGTELPR